jgi:biotin carboxyl carrier protein
VDLTKIEELLAVMRKSGLSQLALEEPGYKVSITRGPERPAAHVTEAHAAPAVMAGPAAGAAPVVDPAGTTTLTVIAPVVGVFRNGGAVTGKKALEVGTRVQRGQLLGVIEAMKVPNEVRSPVEGLVTAVGVADGAAVEYGQMLFLVLPEEGGEVDEGESTLGMA